VFSAPDIFFSLAGGLVVRQWLWPNEKRQKFKSTKEKELFSLAGGLVVRQWLWLNEKRQKFKSTKEKSC